MKKEKLHRLFFVLALLLFVGFCISLGADAAAYNPMANSAPFSVFVLARAVEILIPAAVSCLAAVILRKKFQKESGRSGKRDANNRFSGE